MGTPAGPTAPGGSAPVLEETRQLRRGHLELFLEPRRSDVLVGSVVSLESIHPTLGSPKGTPLRDLWVTQLANRLAPADSPATMAF